MKLKFPAVLLLLAACFLLFANPLFAQQSPLTGNCLNTAIGCIDITNQNAFVAKVLQFSIGIGGGIAFLLILYGGFIVMTSQGDPKKLAGGQETITSAIMGLVLLIFSVFILKIIGIDILQLPGWT